MSEKNWSFWQIIKITRQGIDIWNTIVNAFTERRINLTKIIATFIGNGYSTTNVKNDIFNLLSFHCIKSLEDAMSFCNEKDQFYICNCYKQTKL